MAAMDDPGLFRRRLAARLLGVLGTAWLVAPHAACDGGGARSAGTGGTGGASTTASGSGGTQSGQPCAHPTDCGCWQCACQGISAPGAAQLCVGGKCPTGEEACASVCAILHATVAAATPTATCPGAALNGAGGAGGSGGAGGAGGAPADAGVQWCVDLPADAGSCPTDQMAIDLLFIDQNNGCVGGWTPYQVYSGPTVNASGQCCYEVGLILCDQGGRPYLVDDRPRVSAAGRGAAPGGWIRGARPDLAGLTASERAELARAWTAAALLEHASVASFSRVALALLAVGAPASLVEATHAAALDEVRHARLCFALASAYAGEAVEPGPFPLGGGVEVARTLCAVAVSAFEEGCVGETIAAAIAAEQLARATDPAVREALVQIADDEARHAELAWRTVAWAVRAGGDEVRAAVERVFVDALATAATAGSATAALPDPAPMEAHGRLTAATVAGAAARALAEVVMPAARVLLRRERG